MNEKSLTAIQIAGGQVALKLLTILNQVSAINLPK